MCHYDDGRERWRGGWLFQRNECISWGQAARLAQSVEHGTLNPRVVGSSPTLSALLFHFLKGEYETREICVYL